MLDRLKALYNSYIEHVTDQWTSRDMSDVFGAMFSGRGRFGRDEWVRDFLAELEELIAEAAITPVDGVAASQLTAYMLFDAHIDAPPPAEDGLAAADGRALPLIPLLSPEQLALQYQRYRSQLRRRPGLPCQRKLLQAMKKALTK